MIKAVVYPIIAGSERWEQAPPIALDRASKAAAIRALRRYGYRIMWRDGLHQKLSMSLDELRASSIGRDAVARLERQMGGRLPHSGKVALFNITVWPNKCSWRKK
jgi:hypothetical protein